jgi:hypothetical protein
MTCQTVDRAIDRLHHDSRSAGIGGGDEVKDLVEIGDRLSGPPRR